MATAEGIKAKLQGLIEAANAATGAADADLTAAVQSLIDGFGQSGGGEPFPNATNLEVYEATEDVSAIQIDWRASWDAYDLVIFKPSITFSENDWLYINTNTVTKRQYFSKNNSAKEKQTFAFLKDSVIVNNRLRCFAEKLTGTYLDGAAEDGIAYVYIQPYTSTVVFKSGSKVEVIGVIFQ